MMRFKLCVLRFGLVAFAILSPGGSRADEKLEGKACRSVHLAYSAGTSTAFYNEVTVEQSSPGTYFCACGWNKGYFGIQELSNGKKLVIFSVWDSNQNDPKAVAADKRVQLLHKHDKVRIGRFGGEGTGGQSFFDFEWKVGTTYRFLVTSKVDGDRTEYSGYFGAAGGTRWEHLVTFSTITGGKNLGGFYAFIEDFKRDRVSATRVRKARFGPEWIRTTSGMWEPIVHAKFTADRNPVVNINAGIVDGRFFLATGGDTRNSDLKLNDAMKLPATNKRTTPPSVPSSK